MNIHMAKKWPEMVVTLSFISIFHFRSDYSINFQYSRPQKAQLVDPEFKSRSHEEFKTYKFASEHPVSDYQISKVDFALKFALILKESLDGVNVEVLFNA